MPDVETPLWNKWLRVAQESFDAATSLSGAGMFRAAASRYYYAAYQAATAFAFVHRSNTAFN